ncbi:MAG: lytic murein transglycosylase [Pseudomonadota bacterium]
MLRVFAIIVVLLGSVLGSVPAATAQDKAAIEAQFQGWLRDVIWPMARREGVSKATFETAFKGVRLNWDLPDLVPPGTQQAPPKVQFQAEFGSPGRYFAGGTLRNTTAVGKRMATRHAAALEAAEKATGVPGRIILAIWGRESGFGGAKIPYNTFEVLGTKGFMSRRAAYFTAELVAALQIAEAGHVETLRSSWAGALGQPQFMPSSFLQYAVDGTGDGKADIWASETDTIASIANYLARHGWIAGRDWGFEVRVPSNISCALEGPDQGRRISDWVAMGVTRVSGRPFPDHEVGEIGFLLMPAGRQGPAFIVTPNFYVLKDYNFSDLYALFVGHVGDRIAYNMGDFDAAWGPVGGLSRADVAALQRRLEAMGHDVGGVDGLAGFKTRRSIGLWQEAAGVAATCFPDAAVVKALGG